MDPILKIAADCGAVVIEDGAQSIGAEYKGAESAVYRGDRLYQVLPEQESRRIRGRRHGLNR